MPARRTEETAVATNGGNQLPVLQLPDDVRADLLRVQQEAVTTPQQLSRVKIMAAGAGLYEFEDGNQTVREFQAVILGNHPRNVLWDKRFGSAPASDNPEDKLPACSATDGRYGTPREGFRHAALNGAVATGNERIECARCPYNQWGTGAMVIPTNNPKGKAVTNQRSVYLIIEGRDAPVELVLPPTSIPVFDEYLTSLTNRGVPVQAVMTTLAQEVKSKGSIRWGVAKFSIAGYLENDQFQTILEKRTRYAQVINPTTSAQVVDATVVAGDDELHEPQTEESEIPF